MSHKTTWHRILKLLKILYKPFLTVLAKLYTQASVSTNFEGHAFEETSLHCEYHIVLYFRCINFSRIAMTE